jgi:hypothetical protein
MNEAERRLHLHRLAEGRMQKIARIVENELPDRRYINFAVVTFTVGDGGGYVGYVSNSDRACMVKALRECADMLERKMDLPPGSPLLGPSTTRN